MDKVTSLLEKLLNEKQLIELQLNSPRDRSENSLIKIVASPWETGDTRKYHVTLFYAKNSVDKHLSAQQLIEETTTLLHSHFKQALLYATENDYQLLVSKKGKVTILKKKASKIEQQLQLQHNRPKNYLLKEGTPISFLIALGVMNSKGTVYPKMYDKFRQINRYLETIAHMTPIIQKRAGDRPLRIIDFGCGKSYLTFSLYHYLTECLQLQVHMVGVDLKKEVIESCNTLARQLHYEQLQFIVGAISDYQTAAPVDMVISLHACNTATDVAIAKALAWQAEVILAVPCCQHELLHQIHSNHEALHLLLKHGILRERFAAMATDALRAELLEINGYKAEIVEFIDMEHTPKNILIRAVRREQRMAVQSNDEYEKFRNYLVKVDELD